MTDADDITDWMLIADGVKHDPRCNPPSHPCLRCRLGTAEGLLRELAEECGCMCQRLGVAHVPDCPIGRTQRFLSPEPSMLELLADREEAKAAAKEGE